MPERAATITPDSRLGDLLERWPGLEAVLLDLKSDVAMSFCEPRS